MPISEAVLLGTPPCPPKPLLVLSEMHTGANTFLIEYLF